MQIEATAIPDVRVITTARHGDSRGFFSEVFHRQVFADGGIDIGWVQDNHSRTAFSGTIRGLHFQAPPHAQDKLVRVTRGRIFDVAVDLRRSSPSYGRHVAVELSAENWRQLFVPAGFAHGFCTLEPDTEVLYKVSSHYAPAHDHGVAWNDPALAIAWPVTEAQALLSEKDRRQPRLADLAAYFD